MSGVFLGLVGRAPALEADSGPGGLAVAGGHGDEFHEVKRDVFVAAGAQGESGDFHYEKSSWRGESAGFSGPPPTIAEGTGAGAREGAGPPARGHAPTPHG